jgi:hypothetical protein
MRKRRSNSTFTFNGWKMLWQWRTSAAVGDLTMIDPVDGSKIHSVIGLKRRLGLAEAPPKPPAPDPAPAPAPPALSTGGGELDGETAAADGEKPPRESRRTDMTDEQVADYYRGYEQEEDRKEWE